MGKKPSPPHPEKNPKGSPGDKTHLVLSIGLLAFLLLGFLSLLPWTEEVKATLRRYAITVTLFTPIVVTLFSGLELLFRHKRGPGVSLILAVLVILIALAGGVRW